MQSSTTFHSAKGPIVDPEACTGCGLCTRVCPGKNIRIEYKKAVVGKDCIACAHCSEICPVNAVHVPGIDPEWQRFET